VAGDDAVLSFHEDQVREAVLSDRARDLRFRAYGIKLPIERYSIARSRAPSILRLYPRVRK
jgi:hypothetical protein